MFRKVCLVSEVVMLIHKGPVISKGSMALSTKHANLDIQMEIAAGDPAYYPGNHMPTNTAFLTNLIRL